VEIKTTKSMIITIVFFVFVWGSNFTRLYANNNSKLEESGKETILIVHSGGPFFKETIKGIEDELEEDFLIKFYILKNSNLNTFNEKIKTILPKAIVLMDNQAINFLISYQQTFKKNKVIIPSISVLAVNIELNIENLKNAIGISYEIPIVTSLINLRAILPKKIVKVGIIHRQFMTPFLNSNKDFCQQEGFEIFNIMLPNFDKKMKKKMKNSLNQLIKNDKVDVIWIPNDNNLLNKDTILHVWSPILRKNKIPAIVGVENLVNPNLNFGTFAVFPDNYALGTQAAEMILELKNNNWVVTSSNKTDPPLSIIKVINYRQIKANYKINDVKLSNIDKVLK